MKKTILISMLVITFSVIAWSQFTKSIWNVPRAKAAVSLQTSTVYGLQFSENVGYTFHAWGSDSGLYYINTYGSIDNKFILVKRDTLKFGDVKNTGINYKNVTLRSASVNYLTGFNQLRFTVSAGAVPTADSTAPMGWLLQLQGY